MKHLRYCQNCNKYTLKLNCPECNAASIINKPAKFSPEDPYGSYRRAAKLELLEKRGLL
jgi:H/ACA ribonucleoprotein complex subunit 3